MEKRLRRVSLYSSYHVRRAIESPQPKHLEQAASGAIQHEHDLMSSGDNSETRTKLDVEQQFFPHDDGR